MKPSQLVQCMDYQCRDVRHDLFYIPDIDLNAEAIRLIMISEAAASNRKDGYYAGGNSLFEQTTLQAFNDAGCEVDSIQDLLDMGVYLTTAVKCGKIEYSIATESIRRCSCLLEKEISLFTNVKVFMIMGDVAIKAFNTVARRAGASRVIPDGSTYKIRKEAFYFQGKRVIPSYLQAGPSFGIEKSKRKMIVEDIARALEMIKNPT